MKVQHTVAAFALAAMTIGCNGDAVPTGIATADVARMSITSGIVTRVVGSGHIMRDLGAGEELTTFSYSALARADGTAEGEYQYDFRAAGFSIHGSVTCVTVAGNQGWVGAVIDKVSSPDPEDQALVGTEVWWRVIDNGQGEADPADRSTSLLFAIPGLPVTSASWCNDQEARGLLRDIVRGNIQVQ
jgi:hypothetical protein